LSTRAERQYKIFRAERQNCELELSVNIKDFRAERQYKKF